MNAKQAKTITRTTGAILAILSGVFLLRAVELISAGSAGAVLPIALAIYTFFAGYRAAMRFSPAAIRHATIAAGCWLFILGNLAIRALSPPGALRGLLSLVLLSAVITLCYWAARRLARALNEDQRLV